MASVDPLLLDRKLELDINTLQQSRQSTRNTAEN